MIEPLPKSFSIFCITASSTLSLSALTGTFSAIFVYGITWFLFYSLILVSRFFRSHLFCSHLVLSPLPFFLIQRHFSHSSSFFLILPHPSSSFLILPHPSSSFSPFSPFSPPLPLSYLSPLSPLPLYPPLGPGALYAFVRGPFRPPGGCRFFIRSGNRMICRAPGRDRDSVAVVSDAEPPVGPFGGIGVLRFVQPRPQPPGRVPALRYISCGSAAGPCGSGRPPRGAIRCFRRGVLPASDSDRLRRNPDPGPRLLSDCFVSASPARPR